MAPQGIAYDPATGNLWVVEETTVGTVGTVFEITQAGAFVSSFVLTGGANNFNGIAVDPLTSNLLVADDGQVFEYMKNGTFVGQVLNLPGIDAFGIAVHPVTNNIWIADDEQNEIAEYSRMPAGVGTELSSFSTLALAPGFAEPEGLAFFGPNNDLLVVDNFGGTRTLYLVSTAGALLQTVLDMTTMNIFDPEGVANILDSQLCIAVEGNDSGVPPGSVMNTIVCLNNLACFPPATGVWDVTEDCTVELDAVAPDNVVVHENISLTIDDGVTLDIDFTNHNLTVENGAKVIIQPGGKIF